MERRTYKRINESIKVGFRCCNMDYWGTIINLSEKSMLISTRNISFPFESQFEIFVPLHKEVLNIPIKVSRLLKTGDIYNGIGVELINPTQEYLEFVDSLRPAL